MAHYSHDRPQLGFALLLDLCPTVAGLTELTRLASVSRTTPLTDGCVALAVSVDTGTQAPRQVLDTVLLVENCGGRVLAVRELPTTDDRRDPRRRVAVALNRLLAQRGPRQELTPERLRAAERVTRVAP